MDDAIKRITAPAPAPVTVIPDWEKDRQTYVSYCERRKLEAAEGIKTPNGNTHSTTEGLEFSPSVPAPKLSGRAPKPVRKSSKE